MAVILVLLGGVLGFVSALTSFVAFDATLLQSLAVWSGTGLLGVAAAMTLAVIHRSTQDDRFQSEPEIA